MLFPRIKLFNTQKPTEPLDDEEERERKAEAIKKEIEEARQAQKDEKVDLHWELSSRLVPNEATLNLVKGKRG